MKVACSPRARVRALIATHDKENGIAAGSGSLKLLLIHLNVGSFAIARVNLCGPLLTQTGKHFRSAVKAVARLLVVT